MFFYQYNRGWKNLLKKINSKSEPIKNIIIIKLTAIMKFIFIFKSNDILIL